MNLLSTSLCALLPILYVLKRVLDTRSVKAPLPPGPPKLPLLGNLLNWPAKYSWLAATEWAQTYGDIVHVSLIGTDIIILNSLNTAVKTLQGKGALYSDRASRYFTNELVGWKHNIGHLNDGPTLRERRRLLNKGLGTKEALEKFQGTIEEHTRAFLRRLVEDTTPDGPTITHHVRRLFASNILDVAYGYRVETDNDPFVELSEQVLRDFGANSAPGARLVDELPWLSYLPEWFPGAGFKRDAAVMRKRWLDALHKPYDFAKSHIHMRPSFVANNLEDPSISAERELEVKYSAFTMFGGGTDTSFATLSTFFSQMALCPDVQAKAQAEIDAVVGNDRLPVLSDRPQLPYVDALLNEVHRWSAVGPLGVPHRVKEDDVHEGYLIPKGAMIFTNVWFISRDPKNYKDPFVFNPSRFLGSEPELDPNEYVFGFGRRVCSGRLFADNNLFLAIAGALATLNIRKAVSKDGKEIDATLEYDGTSILLPLPFKCKIEARSSRAEALLSETN